VEPSVQSGAAVDERLVRAGLTRLLGSYGSGRPWVLACASVVVVAGAATLALTSWPHVLMGVACIVAVVLVSSESGTRAGLLCAAGAIVAMIAVALPGWSGESVTTIAGRSFVIVFLAPVVGRAAERSARSRRLLEQVLEATTDLIYVKDLDGRYLLANSATARLIGRPGEELIGRTNAELLPAVAEEIAHHDGEAVGRDESIAYEITGRFGDRDRVLSVTKSPFRDATGTAIGSLGIARDITQQHARQRAFGEAQERFRRAFEDAPIGMALADLDGRFLEVNQALCAITGYSASELSGTTFTQITHPDDLAADFETMRALLDGAVRSSVDEKRYLRPDGSIVWVLRSVTLVRDADGAPSHFLDQIQDVTERRRFEHELRQLADHDPLTGLYNRRRFEQELDRHVADVARYGARGALLVLDLDHFKYVNDALGHHAGDELILSVAAVLQDRLRDTDTVARLGGDEFAVLLPHASTQEAERVAGDLVRAVRDQAAVAAGDRSRRVTTSIGIAPFQPGDLSGEELLIEADLAMYEAKEAGRDGYAVVSRDAERPKRIRMRMSWLERIRSAIDDDRFVLHAQPIRDLRSGEISQYELLLRMVGDDGDLIAPGAFLPLAERFGLAPEIDRWVARHAIELLAADPGGHIALEINLSGLSLSDAGLLHLIETEVARHAVDPRRLIFEITETAAVSNIPLARRLAERLTQLGCRFALDDFGAGFGSFYYLKHLPFDYLKIDGEFISGCLGNKTDQLVIDAVVRIARGLGKETIAEFVSDAALEEFVRSQGVDHAQGFHVGRPVPVAEIGLGQPGGRAGAVS
jgi:diguanylate cyclase (GGDEF)-like protein/PAS domain S-box-containing protein